MNSNITEEEEIKLGADVSAKIRTLSGVAQDAAVHKGRDPRRHDAAPTSRPARSCRGRSSCSTPMASTRLPRRAGSSTSLAGRLRSSSPKPSWPEFLRTRDCARRPDKHTVNAIQKAKGIQIGTSDTPSNRGAFIGVLAIRAYDMVLENSFLSIAATSSTPTRRAFSRCRRRAMPAPACQSFSPCSPSATRLRQKRTGCSRRIQRRRSVSPR